MIRKTGIIAELRWTTEARRTGWKDWIRKCAGVIWNKRTGDGYEMRKFGEAFVLQGLVMATDDDDDDDNDIPSRSKELLAIQLISPHSVSSFFFTLRGVQNLPFFP